MAGKNSAYIDAATTLIIENDTTFKGYLDRYKYPDRYPGHTQTHYRIQAELFLQDLESRLRAAPYLLGDTLSIADAGIFPFIRQFAGVDKNWFAQSPYVSLQHWLKNLLNSERLDAAMKKYPPWRSDDIPIVMSNEALNSCRF